MGQLSLLQVRSPQLAPARTISYLGSKWRVIEQVRATIAAVVPPGGIVCDIFAGSGAVAASLAPRWTVVTNDIQEYARVLCSAALTPPEANAARDASLVNRARTSRLHADLREALGGLLDYERRCLESAAAGDIEDLCDLMEYGSLFEVPAEDVPKRLRSVLKGARTRLVAGGLSEGADSVVSRQFGGIYFAWRQAIELDAILAEVHKLDGRLRDYFLTAALATASEAVNTVGKQFAQPIRPRDSQGRAKRHLVRQTLRDRSIDVLGNYALWLTRLARTDRRPRRRHVSLRADFRDVLRDDAVRFDVVYADPPYTRDHYSRYYHVLETMCMHDDPSVSTTKIRNDGVSKVSRGMYRHDRHQSPFCIKSQAPGAFEELFRGVRDRGVPLVVSYSPYEEGSGARPRLLTVSQLSSLAKKYFRSIEIVPVGGMSHNKFNLTERNFAIEHEAEVLVTCVP